MRAMSSLRLGRERERERGIFMLALGAASMQG